jgi:hypothetical protein
VLVELAAATLIRPNWLSLPDVPQRCSRMREGWPWHQAGGMVATSELALALQHTHSHALFSPCGLYRWTLERAWDPHRPRLLFIGLNPSRADAQHDDPTLRRLLRFARDWGFGTLEVVNLFGRCSASPAVLRRCSDPMGPDNDRWLGEALVRLQPQAGDALWLGWGNGGAWRQRDQQLLAFLAATLPLDLPLWAIGLTASGQPRHPLYAPAAAQPLPLQHPGAVLRLASR